jgi:hypothetical protein
MSEATSGIPASAFEDTIMTTTIDLLRQNFAEACAARDAILAQSNPLRAERDAQVSAAESALAAQVAALNAQIAALEAALPALMNEIAAITIALNGQTSAP